MDGNIEIIDARGLPEEQQEQAWNLFVQNGSMAETARVMGVPYEKVRSVIRRDPIRMEDVRVAQMEAMTSRWRPREAEAAMVAGKLLRMTNDMLDHIEQCQRAGTDTELCDPRTPGRVPLNATQAFQWVLAIRGLDMVQKVGFVAAKIVEGTNMLIDQKLSRSDAAKGAKDPAQMTSAELHATIKELQLAGRPIPFWLEQWQASRSLGGSTSSETPAP